MGIREHFSFFSRGEKSAIKAILSEAPKPATHDTTLRALPEAIRPCDESAGYLFDLAYNDLNANHPLGKISKELFRNQGVISPEQATELSDVPYIPGVINRMTDGSIMSPPIIQGYIDERERTGEIMVDKTKVIVLGEEHPFRIPRMEYAKPTNA